MNDGIDVAPVEFKRQMLDLSGRFAQADDGTVGRAIRESDIILLEVQLSRFEQKRDRWMLRVAETAGRRGGPG